MNKALKKLNCWEFTKCELQHGKEKAEAFGVCPVTAATEYDGINSGKNAGRCCWKVNGTLCELNFRDNRFAKFIHCISCDFFKLVQKEEDKNFTI